MRILVLDNYDSFTYNIVQLLRLANVQEIVVRRNDEIDLAALEKFDRLVLSPGPGLPQEAGKMLEIIKIFGCTKPMLGICLGHQALAEAFGAKLTQASSLMHGKTSKLTLFPEHDELFDNLQQPMHAGRYHSWIVERESLPACLKVSATDEIGQIMAIRHREYNLRGFQFHPESVLTACGRELIERWVSLKEAE